MPFDFVATTSLNRLHILLHDPDSEAACVAEATRVARTVIIGPIARLRVTTDREMREVDRRV